MTADAVRAETIAIVRENLAALKSEREMLRTTLVGHNTVLEMDGLYVKVLDRETLPNGRTLVKRIGVTILKDASRFTPSDAAILCRGGNIRNGNGTTAKPVNLIAALDENIKSSLRLLVSLEA